MKRLQPAIFLISAVVIAYQVALMRIFSIAQWHHFAYMIISVAMLGFGASGTAVALLRRRITSREASWFRMGVFLFILSLPVCYALSQRVPFETFHLVVAREQILYLLLLYTILALPFFLAACCITIGFMMVPGRVGRTYFFNMLGSGAGAILVVVLCSAVPPERLPYFLSLPAAVAFLIIGQDSLMSWCKKALALGLAALAVAGTQGFVPIHVSPYKVMSYALDFPDAKIVSRRQSALSQVTAVTSSHILETPGQLSNYPMDQLGPLPEQAGLFFDAGSISVVQRFDGDLSHMAFLDYVTASLAYQLVDRPNVLVIGAGGGTDVLMALAHHARHVTAVEVDPNVFPLIRDSFRDFSGRLYGRPDVTPVVAEGRGFLQSRKDRYDLIHIALLDSFSTAASGVYALSESTLYTREAITLYLSRLTTNGVLSITRWVKTPPRDEIKLFATCVEACEQAGIEDPSRHLAMIRSWNTVTLVLSHAPLSDAQVQTVRDFCQSRWFDMCHLPGLRADEANRYILTSEPIYFEAAQRLLGPQREAFYDDYLFQIRPATDDQPYFFQFFKWRSLVKLVQGMGGTWIPFVEWGYIALLATLVQGAVISAVLILLPVAWQRRYTDARGAQPWVFVYFSALGLAYMFLEMAFIQKFILFLAYPVYAVSVVLAAFLIFSGIGSLVADRIQHRSPALVGIAVAGIIVCGGLYLPLFSRLYEMGAGWGIGLRITASVILLSPLAFFMGIPFPCGLQLVSNKRPALLPWAWAVNGFASVIGASLATFLAIHIGFARLILMALTLYVVASGSLVRLKQVANRRDAADVHESRGVPL